MSWPAKGGRRGEWASSTERTARRGHWSDGPVLAAPEFSVAEIRTCTCGGGQQGAGKAPNPNKLISANVMFIKFLR